jgi:hypothetical protein
MRTQARYAPWCALLSLAFASACAVNGGPTVAIASTDPLEDPGGGGAARTGTEGGAAAPATPPFLLALTANAEGATGAVFDGKAWKVHAFPGEVADWPSPQVALAPDGTGLVVKGTGFDRALRYARWLGGDAWTSFADVPGSAIEGETGFRDHGAPVSVAYRNGLFVLAYNTTGYSAVVRTFDPRTGTFGPEMKLGSGATKCGTGDGVPRDCVSAASVHLRGSSRGPDEIFVTLGNLGGYAASWKPVLGALPPTVTQIQYGYGDENWDSAPMIPEGETEAVQMHFSFTDRFHEQLGALVPGGPSGTAGGCYEHFKIMPRAASSDVSVLCRGARWSSQSAAHSWERVMEGHLAGGELRFATPVETTLPALTDYQYLPGIGDDTSYVIGVMAGGDVALFRNLDGTPEPFARGTVVGAAASP